MITRLGLKNFVAFDEIEIDFSSKINVIIGENGTGKTQLMKAAYALSWIQGEFQDRGGAAIGDEEVESALTAKLLRLFSPLGDRLGRLHHRGADAEAAIEAEFAADNRVAVNFDGNSRSVSLQDFGNYAQAYAAPIFIPTKEVLTWLRMIGSPDADPKTIQGLFDDTYLDLCAALLDTSTPIDDSQIDQDPRFGSLVVEMVNTINGRYVMRQRAFQFQGGRYEERQVKVNRNEPLRDRVTTEFKAARGAELSANMTAEGFRKVGILQHLLVNQMLNPGVSGPLFWDEPESNMNPKLMRLLVRVLLELSRNGQQIILSTHDYVLLKWLDLLMDSGKEDHVRFHAVFHDAETQAIRCESTDSYYEISPNSIAETFGDLTDYEISRSMKGLGQ